MIFPPRPPSQRDLFSFGLLLPVFIAFLGIVARWGWNVPTVSLWIWAGGAAVAAIYWLIPALRRPLYLSWMYAALPIGWTVSHLLLGIIYYIVITPIGVLMKLLGYDPLHRRFDRQARSYWIRRDQTIDPRRYFRQS
jgi:hypothetical protein